jgi:uncharacterized membrane protein
LETRCCASTVNAVDDSLSRDNGYDKFSSLLKLNNQTHPASRSTIVWIRDIYLSKLSKKLRSEIAIKSPINELRRPLQLLKLAVALLIVRVTVGITMNYGDYIPPNFEAGFLRGRESYFWGLYHWAFYTHIATGPISLFLGLILINDWFRRRHLKWHRILGRVQVACVLLFVVPSGLWMAYFAESGPLAATSLGLLAILTGVCITLGWRAAVRRRIPVHRQWMWRTFILLCSAVVLRVIVGMATFLELTGGWVDPSATWVSWVIPIAIYEGMNRFKRLKSAH